jgi:hypothetical protein
VIMSDGAAGIPLKAGTTAPPASTAAPAHAAPAADNPMNK